MNDELYIDLLAEESVVRDDENYKSKLYVERNGQLV